MSREATVRRIAAPPGAYEPTYPTTPSTTPLARDLEQQWNDDASHLRAGRSLRLDSFIAHARIAGLVALGFLLSFFTARAVLGTKKNYVFVENSNAFRVTLTVDGKPREDVPPSGAVLLALDVGEHLVIASGPRGYHDEGALVVLSQKSGFRGLYAIGGKSRLAIVTKAYGASLTDRVERMPDGSRFVELPADVDPHGIDLPFPETVMAPQGATSASLVHLCHADAEWHPAGCIR
jgi:hypothetical protein